MCIRDSPGTDAIACRDAGATEHGLHDARCTSPSVIMSPDIQPPPKPKPPPPKPKPPPPSPDIQTVKQAPKPPSHGFERPPFVPKASPSDGVFQDAGATEHNVQDAIGAAVHVNMAHEDSESDEDGQGDQDDQEQDWSKVTAPPQLVRFDIRDPGMGIKLTDEDFIEGDAAAQMEREKRNRDKRLRLQLEDLSF